MVIDALKNSAATEKLHFAFKQVFDYVKTHDLAKFDLGRIELDGERLYINIAEVQGKEKNEAVLETHNNYIDIQFPLNGEEIYAWESRSLLVHPRQVYNAKEDITFYTDKAALYFKLTPGKFAVFFPEDGHAPCIGQGKIKKAIAKVRIEESKIDYDK